MEVSNLVKWYGIKFEKFDLVKWYEKIEKQINYKDALYFKIKYS